MVDLRCLFFNQRPSVSVLSLPQYPELLVASYNNNEDAPHEPDGVALVWNIKFKKATPEYIFHCQVLKLIQPLIYIHMYHMSHITFVSFSDQCSGLQHRAKW